MAIIRSVATMKPVGGGRAPIVVGTNRDYTENFYRLREVPYLQQIAGRAPVLRGKSFLEPDDPKIYKHAPYMRSIAGRVPLVEFKHYLGALSCPDLMFEVSGVTGPSYDPSWHDYGSFGMALCNPDHPEYIGLCCDFGDLRPSVDAALAVTNTALYVPSSSCHYAWLPDPLNPPPVFVLDCGAYDWEYMGEDHVTVFTTYTCPKSATVGLYDTSFSASVYSSSLPCLVTDGQPGTSYCDPPQPWIQGNQFGVMTGVIPYPAGHTLETIIQQIWLIYGTYDSLYGADYGTVTIGPA